MCFSYIILNSPNNTIKLNVSIYIIFIIKTFKKLSYCWDLKNQLYYSNFWLSFENFDFIVISIRKYIRICILRSQNKRKLDKFWTSPKKHVPDNANFVRLLMYYFFKLLNSPIYIIKLNLLNTIIIYLKIPKIFDFKKVDFFKKNF